MDEHELTRYCIDLECVRPVLLVTMRHEPFSVSISLSSFESISSPLSSSMTC